MTIAKLLYHPVTIFTVTILAIIFYFSLDASSKQTKKSAENIAVLEHEVNQISQDIITLEEQIEYTDTEEFREKVIRNELLLQKEGEYVLKIADKTENDQNDECENCETTETVITPLQAWINLLL